jgi:NAD(P)-dependent dehydrogenase (short-subunit alcohol dehydrogenase family)
LCQNFDIDNQEQVFKQGHEPTEDRENPQALYQLALSLVIPKPQKHSGSTTITMKSPFWPSFTETWHDKSYPAISPSNPSLSAKDKTVVITGGGTGIGASIARAFAAAGAPRIAILSRTEANLLATKHDLESRFPGTQVLAVPADITDAEQLRKAFAQIRQAFGKLDVFFCNSAYMSSPKPALSPDLDVNDWRFAFETNVLGALNSVRAFMEHAADNAALLHVSTGIAHIPPVVSGVAAYAASKAAATKIFDFIAFENPALHVVNIQPGLIDTQTSRKSGHGGMDHSEST